MNGTPNDEQGQLEPGPRAQRLAGHLRELILTQPTATSDRITERLLPPIIELEAVLREALA